LCHHGRGISTGGQLSGELAGQDLAGAAAVGYRVPGHHVVAGIRPVVNFINILRAAFVPIFFCQKITKPNCN